jgi:hypothetical protein
MIKLDGIIYATIEDAKNALLIAKKVEISDLLITSLDAPAATYLRLINNSALTSLNAPAATELWLINNSALTSLNAPAVTYLRVMNNSALTSIYPDAIYMRIENNAKLKEKK